jgi:SsrA-binding protein
MILLDNKKAHFNYEIMEKLEAGLVLKGFEVKSLKARRGNISGSHVIVRGGEAFVVGMEIPPYQARNMPVDYDPARTRKLLLSKKQIAYLAGKDSQGGLTLVPLTVYTKGGLIKISVGIAKGLKKYDKREKLKKRESEREIERKMKSQGG